MQKNYIVDLVNHLIKSVDEKGEEKLDGIRFLDLLSFEKTQTIHAGLQSMMVKVLAGLMDAKEANRNIISMNGVHGFSTFYGYCMLRAMVKVGYYKGAFYIIRKLLEGATMLDLDATTFCVDFDLNRLPNVSKIDEIVPVGKRDIHGSFGAYCYKSFCHSFCHGWASEPTS